MESSNSYIRSAFTFGNEEWGKQYDDWAAFGKLPTEHWDKASDRERAHGLGLMMRIRGALCDNQEELIKLVALKRAINKKQEQLHVLN